MPLAMRLYATLPARAFPWSQSAPGSPATPGITDDIGGVSRRGR